MAKYKILLTNDDGLHAAGLDPLRQCLCKFAEVTVIAPHRDHSGVSHSITYMRPLRCKPFFENGTPAGFVVDGTPADCVKLAILELMPQKPDLVVSGMNLGLNVGISTFYSGTLAAAVEGAMFGLKALAVSMEVVEPSDFATAAEIAAEVAETMLREPLPPRTILNLNIPSASCMKSRELRLTRLAVDKVNEYYVKSDNGAQETLYQIAVSLPDYQPGDDTDIAAVLEGRISLTPITLDMTAHGAISSLSHVQFLKPGHMKKRNGR